MKILKITREILDEKGLCDLSQIDSDVTHLSTDGLFHLKGFKGAFPEGCQLKEINLSDCKSLRSLDLATLPVGLERLNLSSSGIKTLENAFPEGCKLKEMNLSFSKLTTLNLAALPVGLRRLNLHFCDIETLQGAFPEGCKLKEMNLSFSKLTTLNLAALPVGLERLDLHLSSIEALQGAFSKGLQLKYLNLSDCYQLELTSELFFQLTALARNGCAITYPSHFLDNCLPIIGKKLSDIIELNPDSEKDNVLELFRRFLTEGIRQRGGIEEIIPTFGVILDLLEKNPLAFEWMNNIASCYLEACINQPVNGMTEIAAFTEISQADSILQKLEAARRIVIQDALKSFIAKLPQDAKPGSYVEVEGANALLREIHKILLSLGHIENSWLAVPEKIAYEDTIKTWLKQSLITDAFIEILPILRMDIFEIANLMCKTNHKETWAMILFGDEFKAFKENLNELNCARIFMLEMLKTQDFLSDDDLQSCKEDLNVAQKADLMRFYEKFIQENPEVTEARGQKIDDIVSSIDIERERQISRFIAQKTQSEMPYLTGEVENSEFTKLANVKESAIIY